MEACPGIYFMDEPAGRVAKIAGTGLGVWELIRDYRAVDGRTRRLRTLLPQVSEAGLKAALGYYERHGTEIDEEIAEDALAHEEGLRRQTGRSRRQA